MSQLPAVTSDAAALAVSTLAQRAVATLSTVYALITAVAAPLARLISLHGGHAFDAAQSIASAQLAGVSFAVASADELHARPAFGMLVWLLFASLMRLARGATVPPRALAASQLALSLLYWSGAARLLPPLLVLAAAYLRAATLAAERAREEEQEAVRRLRDLQQAQHQARGGQRAQRERTRSVAELLAGAWARVIVCAPTTCVSAPPSPASTLLRVR